jgi:hypothetical protein
MSMKKFIHTRKSHKPVFSSEHVSWHERLGEDAYVGWVIIFFISLFVAVVLCTLAGWLFFVIESGRITATAVVDSSISRTGFDQTSLNAIVASFDAKAKATSVAGHAFNGPPDPSQ